MFAVAAGNVMRGHLVSAGPIQLDGWLEGDIVCSRLDIGPDGYVLGRVITRELHVAGQIVGSVIADVVNLRAGAFIEGDVRHGCLSVEEGATLSGKALRIPVLRMPDEFLALEARAAAERSDLDRAERALLRAAADRAVVDHPRYQRARAKFPVRRPGLETAP